MNATNFAPRLLIVGLVVGVLMFFFGPKIETAQKSVAPVQTSGQSAASAAEGNGAVPAPEGQDPSPIPQNPPASGDVVAIATEWTLFRTAVWATGGVEVPEGYELHLQFELMGYPGFYGVELEGFRGFVKASEIDLPDGIYTQDNLRELLPWGSWPQP